MKKRVLFMVINMNIGGTEKALLNKIAEMPSDQYDITVLMLEKKGELLKYIPEHVHIDVLDNYSNIKPIINTPPRELIKKGIKAGNIVNGLSFSVIYILSKFLNNNNLLMKFVLKDIKNYKGTYDQAIAYAGPMDLISFFILNKVRATERIQWIHFDVTKIGFNKGYAEKIYSNFDRIRVVSEEGKRSLLKVAPGLKEKVLASPNRISETKIKEMASESTGFQDNYNGFRILTVGRLSYEKGQDLIIKVAADLKRTGFKIRWYCIGEGKAREEYEELIKLYGLQEDFILLGATLNPYPYMKECDLYVQPSRHEGYCLTLAEAKVFNKPIVSTNFTGAYEQLDQRKNARVVNFDELEMNENIIMLLKNINKVYQLF
ncbi:glycosyltransferase [Halobacillus sp. K22]|uniref:glycosyltransferase n=1 Tax=Halobacillus sp. K22 TaxID=3457431 RepID=UPI003FCEAB84